MDRLVNHLIIILVLITTLRPLEGIFNLSDPLGDSYNKFANLFKSIRVPNIALILSEESGFDSLQFVQTAADHWKIMQIFVVNGQDYNTKSNEAHDDMTRKRQISSE